MCLSAKDASHFSTLDKGFEGELKFDKMLEPISEKLLIINDLLLEHNHTLFQIDTTMIFRDTLSFFDVKNFENDYIMKGDKWYTLAGSDVKSPLHQKDRAEILFRGLLHDLGYKFPIDSSLVFVNPQFYLYQATPNLPIIFHHQIDRLMTQLIRKSGNLKDHHYQLTEKLISLNITDPPFTRVPEYTYEQLKKGPSCACWRGFMKYYNRDKLVCPVCGRIESIDSVVMRNVDEFTMLFPDRKITTKSIFDWCELISEKNIWRILSRNYNQLGHGKSTIYIK